MLSMNEPEHEDINGDNECEKERTGVIKAIEFVRDKERNENECHLKRPKFFAQEVDREKDIDGAPENKVRREEVIGMTGYSLRERPDDGNEGVARILDELLAHEHIKNVCGIELYQAQHRQTKKAFECSIEDSPPQTEAE